MTDVEQLLLDFNRNPDNRELQDFYSRKSMMEMMGVARSEVAHSAFLAWLLSGKDVCVHSADSPLMWLFQVLVLREYTSQSIFFSNDIKTRILNRSLGFEILEVVQTTRTENQAKTNLMYISKADLTMGKSLRYSLRIRSYRPKRVPRAERT